MKYSVLVVDDETLIAKNIKKNIEASHPDFEVVQICSCGMDALDYIRKSLPQVVFTDIRMPEMDGLELVRKISQEFPFIICLIVSGYNDFEYAKTAISCNVFDYILKPINRDELTGCLLRLEKAIQLQYPSLEKAQTEEDNSRSSEEIVSLVKEYIHKNYHTAIDFSLLSKNLGFSAPYLTKIFTKHTDMTPSKYLKNYRITIAKQLLHHTDTPLSSISEQTGFADQFHFSKTFKAVTGLSPSEYRQKKRLT